VSTAARAALSTAFVLAWSSGFIGAELATRTAGTATVLAWRFLVAAPLLLVPMLLWRSLVPSWRQVRFQAGIGLLAQCGYLGGVVLAIELGVPSGTTALVAALQPLVATAAAGSLLRERVSSRQWAGLWIGLAGVAVVVGGDLTGTNVPWPAYLLPVGAMLSLVAATLAERRHSSRPADRRVLDAGRGYSASDNSSLHPERGRGTGVTAVPLVTAVGIQCAVSAVLFSSVALTRGEFVPPASGAFVFAIGWVVLLSTFGGYGLYWLVLRTSGVARVSSLLYLTPAVTLLSGALMFGDPVTATTVAGTVVCLAAVWLVQRRSAAEIPPDPRTVTERDLRRHSDVVLRRVAAGGTVQVSRGGRPVAEIRPLAGCAAEKS
jgi:drug/metabolite transporter (DMT)-like permease